LLSQISLADVASNPRGCARAGALITCGGEALRRERAFATSAAMSVAWLRPDSASARYGSGATEAGQAGFTWQQRSNRKPNHTTHTTRIAAAGGGALGSHPARDPV